jgi:hypothetical protein
MESAMIDARNLTLELIRQEESNLVSHVAKDSLMDVFRKNFDLWENELFPLLKLQRKNRYDFVCSILGRCGYEVSAEQVGLYLTKVRAERGTKKNRKEKIYGK